jgi:hypothetical protein
MVLSNKYRTEVKKNWNGNRDVFMELWNKKKGILIYIPLKSEDDGNICVGIFRKQGGAGTLVYSHGRGRLEIMNMDLHEFKKRFKVETD